jgi:hypothetical protein
MLGVLLPATIDMMEKLAESYKATIAVFHGIIATWLFKVFSETQLDEFYFVVLVIFFSVANLLLWRSLCGSVAYVAGLFRCFFVPASRIRIRKSN